MNRLIHALSGAFLLIIVSPAAYAACSIVHGSGALAEMNMSMTVSAGNDLPVGGVLFEVTPGQYGIGTPNNGFRVQCTTVGQFYHGLKVSNVLYGIASVQPGTNTNNQVYNTMLPGVGVRAVRDKVTPSSNCVSTNNCGYPDITDTSLNRVASYVFMKTGPITPGAIDLSTIPVSRQTMGQAGAMVVFGGVRLKGTLRITVPTCTIQQAGKTVKLGTFDVNGDFSGTDNATPWVNTGGIALSCAAFSGRQDSYILWDNKDGYTSVPARTANTYTIAFSRTSNAITDAARGIIAIDSASSGTASGVGIQLSTTPGTAGIINLANEHVRNLPLNTAGAVTFPLYARYIRTGSKITAGRADGRLTFTVSYK